MRRRGDSYSVEELRKLATSHMAERAEDFMPYMLNESGDLMSQSKYKRRPCLTYFKVYCLQ